MSVKVHGATCNVDLAQCTVDLKDLILGNDLAGPYEQSKSPNRNTMAMECCLVRQRAPVATLRNKMSVENAASHPGVKGCQMEKKTVGARAAVNHVCRQSHIDMCKRYLTNIYLNENRKKTSVQVGDASGNAATVHEM